MATHSSILAWRVPQTEELVGNTPWGCKESERTERTCMHNTHPRTLGAWPGKRGQSSAETTRNLAASSDLDWHGEQDREPHGGMWAEPVLIGPNCGWPRRAAYPRTEEKWVICLFQEEGEDLAPQREISGEEIPLCSGWWPLNLANQRGTWAGFGGGLLGRSL